MLKMVLRKATNRMEKVARNLLKYKFGNKSLK